MEGTSRFDGVGPRSCLAEPGGSMRIRVMAVHGVRQWSVDGCARDGVTVWWERPWQEQGGGQSREAKESERAVVEDVCRRTL